jgi:hypothetical protein
MLDQADIQKRLTVEAIRMRNPEEEKFHRWKYEFWTRCAADLARVELIQVSAKHARRA